MRGLTIIGLKIMKKLYLLVIPLCAAFTACSTSVPAPAPKVPTMKPAVMPTPSPAVRAPATPAPAPVRQVYLAELQVDTDLSTVDAPMDWIQIFSAISFSNPRKAHNLGFKQRVASFGSAADLKADSLAHLKLVSEVPANKKPALAEEMVKRAASQVNFATHDFVAVYLTASDPTGEYRYAMAGDTMEFCIDKPSKPTKTAGKALNNIVKFYAAPKGLTVKACAS